MQDLGSFPEALAQRVTLLDGLGPIQSDAVPGIEPFRVRPGSCAEESSGFSWRTQPNAPGCCTGDKGGWGFDSARLESFFPTLHRGPHNPLQRADPGCMVERATPLGPEARKLGSPSQ